MFSQGGARDCSGVGRRDFLRIGGLGLGGMALPWWFQKAAEASGVEGYVKDKSIVFLFLCGGPSQMETFDPNMDAPAPMCSMTGEVKTSLPGVTFGSTFKKMAKLAKKMAVVRSYSPHGINDHAKAIRHVFTAGGQGASLGAIYTRLVNRSADKGGMPTFTQLIEQETDPQYMEDMQRMRSSNAAGRLGANCAPFAPGGNGKLNQDMRLNLPLERLDDRRGLLKELDRLNRASDTARKMVAVDEMHGRAVDLILGGATRKAMDLSREDPRNLRKYDTSRFVAGYLKKRRSHLGKRMLMARRLVEAGCRFVTVGMAGWDNHGNGNHPGMVEGMQLLGRPLDHAVSAFVEDVEARGLSDKVLLVITGEFGRTAKIQAKGGRDHWPGLCPLVFVGGGLKMGQVIGASQKGSDYPKTDPYRLGSLTSTMMHSMFDVGALRVQQGLPGDLVALAEKERVIGELF